jgi:hypothetical protein
LKHHHLRLHHQRLPQLLHPLPFQLLLPRLHQRQLQRLLLPPLLPWPQHQNPP